MNPKIENDPNRKSIVQEPFRTQARMDARSIEAKIIFSNTKSTVKKLITVVLEFEGDGGGRMNLKVIFESTVSTVEGKVRSNQSSSTVINN